MKQSAKNGHQHHHHLFVNEGEGFDSALTESVCTTWRELAAQTSATQATDFIVLHQLTQRPSAQDRATGCSATVTGACPERHKLVRAQDDLDSSGTRTNVMWQPLCTTRCDASDRFDSTPTEARSTTPRHRLQRHWTAKENRPSAQRGATQATDLIVHHLSPYVVPPGATGCRGRLDFTETSKGRLSYYGGRQHLESLPTEIRHDQVYLAKLPASYSWRPPCGIWVSHQIR